MTLCIIAVMTTVSASGREFVYTAQQLIRASLPPYSVVILAADIVLPSSASPVVEIATGSVLSIIGGGSAANPPTLDLSSTSALPVFLVLQGKPIRRSIISVQD